MVRFGNKPSVGWLDLFTLVGELVGENVRVDVGESLGIISAVEVGLNEGGDVIGWEKATKLNMLIIIAAAAKGVFMVGGIYSSLYPLLKLSFFYFFSFPSWKCSDRVTGGCSGIDHSYRGRIDVLYYVEFVLIFVLVVQSPCVWSILLTPEITQMDSSCTLSLVFITANSWYT